MIHHLFTVDKARACVNFQNQYETYHMNLLLKEAYVIISYIFSKTDFASRSVDLEKDRFYFNFIFRSP